MTRNPVRISARSIGLTALILTTASFAYAIDVPPAPPAPTEPPAPPAPKAEAEPKADELPPVFARLSLDKAVEQNGGDGRILVVKATAVWCGPCKKMDKTTWRDDAVVDWFRAKGVAISLDVDQHPEDSQKLRIEAMPTMVAFKGGKEVDRVVGYKSAGDLIEWLGQVERGETAETRLAARLKAPREGEGALSMQARMELAGELARMGRNAEATEEYVWLWDNMIRVQPSMVGVRVSFMAGDMTNLAAADAGAKARFTALRDSAHQRSQGPGRKFEDLSDWIVLNEIIGDEAATLAWFDRAKQSPRAEQTLARLEHRIMPLLEKHDRWADLGRLIKNPTQKLAADAQSMKMMIDMSGKGPMSTGDPKFDQEMRESMIEYARTNFRESAGRMYACLLAAERTEDAERIADRAMNADPEDPELMAQELVRSAIRAGQARESMRDLLKPRPLPSAQDDDAAEPAKESTLEERNRAEHARVVSDATRAERRTAAMQELEEALKNKAP